jgi:hypothetical protein
MVSLMFLLVNFTIYSMGSSATTLPPPLSKWTYDTFIGTATEQPDMVLSLGR